MSLTADQAVQAGILGKQIMLLQAAIANVQGALADQVAVVTRNEDGSPATTEPVPAVQLTSMSAGSTRGQLSLEFVFSVGGSANVLNAVMAELQTDLAAANAALAVI